jgi:hypothetical protein
MAVAFLFTFALVFTRSAMSDILDIQSDKLLGRETIPVMIGKEKTQGVLKAILLISLIILLAAHPAGWSSALGYFLASCILYIWICFRLCDRRAGLSGAVVEGPWKQAISLPVLLFWAGWSSGAYNRQRSREGVQDHGEKILSAIDSGRGRFGTCGMRRFAFFSTRSGGEGLPSEADRRVSRGRRNL